MKKYYYSIGEVGNLLNLKDHVLRYWEKEFPQLKPRKTLGRNRKYSPEDIELIKLIKFMLYDQKYTIDGARRKLKEQKKEKTQIELSFKTDKKDLKEQITRELKLIKRILTNSI